MHTAALQALQAELKRFRLGLTSSLGRVDPGPHTQRLRRVFLAIAQNTNFGACQL